MPEDEKQHDSFPEIKEPLIPLQGDERSRQQIKNLVSEAKREDEIGRVKHNIIIGGFISCAIILGALVGCRIWHLLLPDYGWLTQAGLDRIEDFFIDGSIGAAILGFVKKVIFK